MPTCRSVPTCVASAPWPRLLIHRFRSGRRHAGQRVPGRGRRRRRGRRRDATVSGGRGLRARVDALGKPLLGVVVTHAHPDHYGGLVELRRRPRRAGLRDRARRRRDPPRRPGQGADPAPDVRRRVGGRARVPDRRRGRRRDGRARRHRADGDRPRARASRPPTRSGRSRTSRARVFSADLAYDRMHCYLADGFHAQWLANLAPAARRAAGRRDAAPRPRRAVRARGARLAGGLHRAPCSTRCARPTGTRPDEARSAAMERIRAYLPAGELQFLVELSLEPLAAQLEARSYLQSSTETMLPRSGAADQLERAAGLAADHDHADVLGPHRSAPARRAPCRGRSRTARRPSTAHGRTSVCIHWLSQYSPRRQARVLGAATRSACCFVVEARARRSRARRADRAPGSARCTGRRPACDRREPLLPRSRAGRRRTACTSRRGTG